MVVHSMDRLARNLDDLRRIVQQLTSHGVRIEFVKEQLTFSGEDSPLATLLLSVMGVFRRIRAGPDPRTAARGHRSGQAAWGLSGPQESALARASGVVPPPERQGYQVLTPFGKLGYSPKHL